MSISERSAAVILVVVGVVVEAEGVGPEEAGIREGACLDHVKEWLENYINTRITLDSYYKYQRNYQDIDNGFPKKFPSVSLSRGRDKGPFLKPGLRVLEH
jgi:hypothetical protein